MMARRQTRSIGQVIVLIGALLLCGVVMAAWRSCTGPSETERDATATVKAVDRAATRAVRDVTKAAEDSADAATEAAEDSADAATAAARDTGRTATAAAREAEQAAAAATRAAIPTRTPIPCQGYIKCDDFPAFGESPQSYWERCGRPAEMDRDGDGVVCESWD